MPKRRAGRTRIDYKGGEDDGPFIDAVKEAAYLAGQSVSQYLRTALEQRMEREGVPVPPRKAPPPSNDEAPDKKKAGDA
jgi:hypothetical protein